MPYMHSMGRYKHSQLFLLTLLLLGAYNPVAAATIVFHEPVNYRISINSPKDGADLSLGQGGSILLMPKVAVNYSYTLENTASAYVPVADIVEFKLAGPTATQMSLKISEIDPAPPGSPLPRDINAFIVVDERDAIRLTEPGSYSLTATFKIMAHSEELFKSPSSAKVKFKVGED